MKSLSRTIKTILKAAAVWFGLTVIFLVADSSLSISEKVDWFPVIALLLPVLCAALYLVWAAKRDKPRKESKPKATPPPVVTPEPPREKTILERIDEMDGTEFERFCAELLDDFGYQQIHMTKSTGDQGVDITAIKGGLRYAFQCKRYSSKIGNAAVQQVNTGKMLYSCQKAVVITNNYFTAGAKKAAAAVGVELWDRDVLSDKIAKIMRSHAAP